MANRLGQRFGKSDSVSQVANLAKFAVVKAVDATIPAGVGKYVRVAAPSVAGYRFVCWLCATTSGWVGHVYIAYPPSAEQSIWNNSANGGAVQAFALYLPVA